MDIEGDMKLYVFHFDFYLLFRLFLLSKTSKSKFEKGLTISFRENFLKTVNYGRQRSQLIINFFDLSLYLVF